MPKKLFTVLFIPLIAAIMPQATAAAEHHHPRTKHRAALSERLLNSNAYAAPGDFAVQSGAPNYDEGAMTSGIAGH